MTHELHFVIVEVAKGHLELISALPQKYINFSLTQVTYS